EEQVSNTTSSIEQASPTYPKQQKRFDDKFTQKDVMNKIRKIVSLPVRDMSNNKGSLEDIHLWDYLLSNYGAKEGINKQAPKFSVIDDIFEIYGLPGIHECINGQRPLRLVIDIDASKEKMEAENKEIIKELVIMISSKDNKYSYHLLYASALLVDYLELKEFTELVFRLTGEKYKKFIDRELPDRNFCFRLIGSAKKDRVKHILQFSLDNDVKKINQKKIIVGQDSLKKYTNLVLQEYSDYLGG
ncbi:2759_t:CDS:2, partial [Scutellospora calospora]